MLALRQLVTGIANEVAQFGQRANVPDRLIPNLRNDKYLVSEALRLREKSGTPL